MSLLLLVHVVPHLPAHDSYRRGSHSSLLDEELLLDRTVNLAYGRASFLHLADCLLLHVPQLLELLSRVDLVRRQTFLLRLVERRQS